MATNQPFTILVLGLEQTPELEALAAQGHTLIYGGVLSIAGAEMPVDKVVGPHCWRLLPDQMKWVPLMVKEMRALQPRVKKVKVKKSDTV